ncbi:MAG: 2-dehydropantoate 2-reductase [Candidatus Tectomicrobia bacterium]|nr:2-dehydropantoate 2-reductase [Candidatus Tectomicrobia bacterium]
MMKVTVFGAGAIGGVTGAYLARGGVDVTLVDKVKEHVEAINQRGLFLDGIRGELTVPVKAITPDQLSGPLELVLLAVKAMNTEESARTVLPYLGEGSIVVSMQNGLNEPLISEMIGYKRTIGCFVNFGADYHGPGHIRHGGVGSLYIGELDGKITPRIQEIQKILSNVTTTYVTENIWGYLWSKLTCCSLYFITALVDATIAEVVSHKKYQEFIVKVVSEAVRVARAEEIRLEQYDYYNPTLMTPETPEEWQRAYGVLDQMAEKTSKDVKTKTGIWRDLAVRKRKTEVDFQSGVIIEKAKKHQLETPLTEAVVKMVKEIEDGKRGMAWENLDELLLFSEPLRV